MTESQAYSGMEPLPTLTANVVGFPYIDIVPNYFSYSLGVDRWNFGYWAEKVMENEIYFVNTYDEVAAYRYSPFLITHQCNTG